MTNEQRKEPEKLFDEICSSFTGDGNHYIEYVSKDAFLETVANLYSEIEARDRRFEELLNLWNPVDEYVRPLTSLGFSVSAKALELVKRVERLEEIIKAANAVIVNSNYENYGTVKFEELVNAYNKLKSKLPSGI